MDRHEQFKGRDFLTLTQFTAEEIYQILDYASELKRKQQQKQPHTFLSGKTVAMIFEKQSTRTRFSFQVACTHLGMQSFFATPDTMQLARGEPIKDTARILDRYCDALVIRTYGQEIVEEYARFMEKPVINALSDLTHPCQGLADMLTILEKKKKIAGNKLVYIGDPWNVCHSLMICCSLLGMDCYIAVPKGWKPAQKILDFALTQAKNQQTQMVITDDLEEAMHQADIVYVNTFHSMGHKDIEQRKKVFAPFQINDKTIDFAKHDAIVMHCMPAYRNEEISESILESQKSVLFDQGENRLHTEKAILSLVITV